MNTKNIIKDYYYDKSKNELAVITKQTSEALNHFYEPIKQKISDTKNITKDLYMIYDKYYNPYIVTCEKSSCGKIFLLRAYRKQKDYFLLNEKTASAELRFILHKNSEVGNAQVCAELDKIEVYSLYKRGLGTVLYDLFEYISSKKGATQMSGIAVAFAYKNFNKENNSLPPKASSNKKAINPINRDNLHKFYKSKNINLRDSLNTLGEKDLSKIYNKDELIKFNERVFVAKHKDINITVMCPKKFANMLEENIKNVQTLSK